jgi:hypothetical protein
MSEPARLATVSLFGLLGLVLWLRAWRWVSGSTLAAAWAWIGVTLAAQIAAGLADDSSQSAWGYLAAITVFGPTMAVLGAKRPQHRAWQFVVLVLLVVLAMPGLEALVFARRAVEVHGLHASLMALLIAIGVFNYLPTRFWPAALCAGAGQALLLGPYLPGVSALLPAPEPVAALVCEVLAAAMVTGLRQWTGGASQPIDRLWTDFRNSLGAIWALRVQERFNVAARQHAWPVRLEWSGLQTVDQASDPAQAGSAVADARDSAARRQAVAERTLRMLLHRFVSESWNQRRL